MKLLLVCTGGTICSRTGESGLSRSDGEAAVPALLDAFRRGASPCREAEFKTAYPLDILSENMGTEQWNTLLSYLRTVENTDFSGILIAHGTDTLAYTAALLALVLGSLVPVVLVSSTHRLDDERASGHANFRAAVELIASGLRPGVWSVNRSSDGELWLHNAAHLCQCGDYTDDFYSATRVKTKDFPHVDGLPARAPAWPGRLEDSVLYLRPYVGMRYDRLDLGGVKAVVHSLYHSGTARTERENDPASLLYLLKTADFLKIPVFVTPCRGEEGAVYETTGALLRAGALPLYGMTAEMAYVKALVGVSLSLSGEKLYSYMRTDVAGEFVYR